MPPAKLATRPMAAIPLDTAEVILVDHGAGAGFGLVVDGWVVPNVMLLPAGSVDRYTVVIGGRFSGQRSRDEALRLGSDLARFHQTMSGAAWGAHANGNGATKAARTRTPARAAATKATTPKTAARRGPPAKKYSAPSRGRTPAPTRPDCPAPAVRPPSRADRNGHSARSTRRRRRLRPPMARAWQLPGRGGGHVPRRHGRRGRRQSGVRGLRRHRGVPGLRPGKRRGFRHLGRPVRPRPAPAALPPQPVRRRHPPPQPLRPNPTFAASARHEATSCGMSWPLAFVLIATIVAVAVAAWALRS